MIRLLKIHMQIHVPIANLPIYMKPRTPFLIHALIHLGQPYRWRESREKIEMMTKANLKLLMGLELELPAPRIAPPRK